ncbi:MAG: hypothetical protein IBX68_01070, partial [Dehalococcoidia bacterium]|nr:hypothetical protein [Dehalococcoidia bacterium]
MGEFKSSLQHLMAELERVDLRLRLRVHRIRQKNGQRGEDEFRGLYISEDDLDSLMADGVATRDTAAPEDDPSLVLAQGRLEKEVARRKRGSAANGVRLRLSELADKFSLNPFEVDTLLICLLPEVDIKYEKLFAYLHDDITRKRPSVDLVLQCLLESLDARLAARDAFMPGAPLTANSLVRIEEDSASRSLLARTLQIDDRVAGFLLESDRVDGRLSACARLIRCPWEPAKMMVTDEVRSQLDRLAEMHRISKNTFLVYFRGPAGSGRKTAAGALCREWALPLLTVEFGALLSADIQPEIGIRLAFREARLQDATLCWDSIDPIFSQDNLRLCAAAFVEEIGAFDGPIFAAGEAAWQPGDVFGGRSFFSIELDRPSSDMRKKLWESCLDGQGPGIPASGLQEIADRFRFTPAQVRDAAAAARNCALGRGSSQISIDDLYAAIIGYLELLKVDIKDAD